ncbi:MAG: hypothetical protein WA048_01995 [Minisyncoccia bacterium]
MDGYLSDTEVIIIAFAIVLVNLLVAKYWFKPNPNRKLGKD